jgi:2-methylisocitrate lyase-like PEP mutase family enzyme
MVAWGDDDAICERVQAQWDAGADHVCIQMLGETGVPDLATLERVAAKIG